MSYYDKELSCRYQALACSFIHRCATVGLSTKSALHHNKEAGIHPIWHEGWGGDNDYSCCNVYFLLLLLSEPTVRKSAGPGFVQTNPPQKLVGRSRIQKKRPLTIWELETLGSWGPKNFRSFPDTFLWIDFLRRFCVERRQQRRVRLCGPGTGEIGALVKCSHPSFRGSQ